MRPLQGRVVVITGPGSGLGRSLAMAFARQRCRVHGLERDPERAESLVREATNLPAGSIQVHVADCTDRRDFEAAVDSILATEGRLDVFIANAGTVVSGQTERLPESDWEAILDLNWRAVVHGVRKVLPGMMDRGEGHLVLVASMAGWLPLPTVAPYCATKAAVAALGESLAIELSGTGVGVTTVCTGSLRTRVLEDGRLRLPGQVAAGLRRAMAWGAGSPDALARRIVRAVRWNRPLVVAPRELWPLWLLRRISYRLYLAVMGLLFRRPLRMLRRARNGGTTALPPEAPR